MSKSVAIGPGDIKVNRRGIILGDVKVSKYGVILTMSRSVNIGLC